MSPSPTRLLAESEFRRLGGGKVKFRLDPELPSFEIAREEGVWLLSGPTETELLYAVYDCAERFLGYDFFEPGTEDFDPEQVRRDLSSGVLVPARKPLLRRRGFIQEFPFDPEKTRELFDWMAKNKLNYLLVWMKYYDELPFDLKRYASCRGIVIESGHHNFEYLIPLEKYGRSHPEYFALRPRGGGEKELPGVRHATRQLCTTEPGLREEIARNLLAYAAKHPELTRLGLNPNDGFGWCECPRCRTYYQADDNRKCRVPTPGKPYFFAENAYDEFIGSVAGKIHAERPDLVLDFFGYVNYSSPAKNFRLTRGIAVELANYWRCVQHDLDDPACPTNRGFLRDLLAWEKAKNGGELLIYEYYMGINFYMSLPLLFWKRMFDELQSYRDHAVDGVLTQFQLGHWSVYGSNYRFMAAAARGESYEDARTRFFTRRFPGRIKEAEAFFDAVQAVVDSVNGCHIPTPASLFSRIKLEQLEKLLPPARHLARKLPGLRPAADLACWVRYLVAFKKLYDSETARRITVEEMRRFRRRIARESGRRIFASPVQGYLKLWQEDIAAGRPCRFFDVDWPSEFRRRAEEAAGAKPSR